MEESLNDIRLLQYFDEETLTKEVGITRKITVKLFLHQIEQFKEECKAVTNVSLSTTILSVFVLRPHCIVTLFSLCSSKSGWLLLISANMGPSSRATEL